MIRFAEGARCGGVSVFDIKPTREANVPIIMAFLYVGIVGIAYLWSPHLRSRLEWDDAAAKRDDLAGGGHTGCALVAHVIRERGTSAAPAATAPAAPTRLPCTTSGMVIAGPGWKLLLDWDRQLLNRRDGHKSPPTLRVGRRRRER